MYLAGDSAGSEGEGGLLKQKQLNPYVKPLPSKSDILRLLESCSSPGAKLAVGLAAFSGLRPGQVRELVFQNLVEFSTAGKQFSHVPSRIELWGTLQRRSIPMKWYTFLSTSGCRWLLEDLKTRTQPTSTNSKVVTAQAFREAEKVIHAAGLKWFDLRDYCKSSFMVADTKLPREVIDYMFGYAVKEDVFLSHFIGNLLDPRFRQEYVRVEERLFV